MFKINRFYQSILYSILFLLAVNDSFPQKKQPKALEKAKPVMWKPVKIQQQNLYFGPGGKGMQPNLKRITLIRKEKGGNNLKYRIKDGSGRIWVAKIADESQPETAAVRLLWGIGYLTEINYLAPNLTIPGKGKFKNVRLEARPTSIDRQDRWSWTDNPFVGTKELQGLKIMMALINNWDLKDGNNIILQTGQEQQYVISDLGSAFGKLAPLNVPVLNRFGRSVNRPDHFAKSEFIKGIENDGDLDFAYKGKAKDLFDKISPEEGLWLANLLNQLSDKQISDAFRAANYTPREIKMLTRAVRGRIGGLTTTTSLYGKK